MIFFIAPAHLMRSDRSVNRFRLLLTMSLCAGVIVIMGMLVAGRRQKALGALHASGFSMGRGIPFPESPLWSFVDHHVVDAIEFSGWLPGKHVVSRVGPPPRTVSQEALEALVYLQCAATLYLPESQLTDEDLEFIGRVRTIQTLDISGNPIGDSGLEHLKSLPSLRCLYVINTDVTDEALERFRAALPLCEVWGKTEDGEKNVQ